MNSGALANAVCGQIEEMREQIIATLADLVRIPSITPKYPGIDFDQVIGGESRCNAALRAAFEAAGCEIDMWEEEPGRANLVGVVKGTGGGRSLICNGHVDTVPPGDPSAWRWEDPWSGRLEDGRLYGLGACDMKAGLVAQAAAAEALRRCGIRLRGDLILESVVGEETMDHERGTTAAVRRGYVADAAIVTEPSALPAISTLAPCSPGAFWLRVRIKGKTTHSCVRGSLIWPGGAGEAYGVDAIDKAILIANAVQRLEQTWGMTKAHPLFPPGHFTIGANVILGKPPGPTAPFAIADDCYIDYIVIYPPGDDPEAVKDEVERFVRGASDLDPWLRSHPPAMEWPHHWPAYNTALDHPICRSLAAAHEQALGEPVTVRGFAAVDDATYLERGGVPAVTFGPGNLLVCHAADEYVETGAVMRACKVYALTAIGWCGLA